MNEKNKPQKATLLYTIWVALLSLIYTGNTCLQAIIRGASGSCSREWVDSALQTWVKRILNLVGVRYQVFNPHHIKPIPGQPTIVMCNHSSLYDIPLSLYAFPNHSLRMLAKKEMSRLPIMARAMKASEFPFIDRKNRRQAIMDLMTVEELLKSGIVMWIAPEGTRSKTGNLQPFKKGAFITAINTHATIIPIGIRGACDILPAKTYRLNLNQRAEIHIGKPIDASQYTLENKEALIAVVHESMKQLVGESSG